MPRRGLALALSFLIGLAGATNAGTSEPATAAELKVLRYAFPVAESGFDPAQISDLYSRVIAANIFDVSFFQIDAEVHSFARVTTP